MLKKIESLLELFRSCFHREGTFKWFVITIAALMVRADRLGVTSFIRDLCLAPCCYENLIHFFRSSAFSLSGVRRKWIEIVSGHAPVYRVNGRAILVGDGVKQCKEARKMPAVKKMIQESETCSKPEYIHGHFFGAVGAVIGLADKKFCIPLKANIQDGLRAAAAWTEAGGITEISSKSHIEQIVESAFEAAEKLGKSFLLLDRFFLSRPALALLDQLNLRHSTPQEGNLVEIITKAKANVVAFQKPEKNPAVKPGRPRIRGNAVKLGELFSKAALFKEAEAVLYGKAEDISYYSVDLLWKQGLYKELRFVLVKYGPFSSIFVSTDLTLDPVRIVELYTSRFSIEELFREFKQQLGGFCYRFWTACLPRLDHFAKKGSPDPLEMITTHKDRVKVLKTIRAIETFVLCASIAMGMLQLLAMDKDVAAEASGFRYLRTRTHDTPSEATVMYYLRKGIFLLLACNPASFITKYIREKQTAVRRPCCKGSSRAGT